MIQVADNFNYRGKKPNFDRDSFDTLYDMKNYSENSLDDGHISYCKETSKHYKFNSNNQSDPTTGKWIEQHEAVPADEEDITEQNGTLQLANKTYDKQSFSGLGRVYLRKNIVGDTNCYISFVPKTTDTHAEIKLFIYARPFLNKSNTSTGNATVKTINIRSYGDTQHRPIIDRCNIGTMYFDTTLGKPIFNKNNSQWIDATGATV